MKAYISGGMTGKPFFAFPTFDAVSAAARLQGIEVVSPAEHDRQVCRELGVSMPEMLDGFNEGDLQRYHTAMGTSFEDLLGWDTQVIVDCDAIIMLPSWESSTGARHERYVAEACGKQVYLAYVWLADSENMGWRFGLDPEQKRMSCVLMSRLGGVPSRPVYAQPHHGEFA